MWLPDLLRDVEVATIRGEAADRLVGGVTCDSRSVSLNDVFVCIDGTHADGHSFVVEAMARGAAALVVDAGRADAIARSVLHPADSTSSPVLSAANSFRARPTIIGVPDTRLAYALLCAAVAGRPASDLHLIGVTGTNGKTTTVVLIDSVFRAAGYRTSLVSTVYTRIGDDVYTDDDGQRLTTPDALELQRIFRRMREQRVERTTIEISSHALAMHRVGGCLLRSGVFTNMARDHLDFHGGWEQYFQAKRRLLSLLDGKEGYAVINVDDRWGRRLAEKAGSAVVDFALHRSATIRGRIIHRQPTYTVVDIQTPAGLFTVRLPLPGTCNVYNALAAAAVAWADGVSLAHIAKGLANAPPPPGRFHLIHHGQPFLVFVDFAHNPQALLRALDAVRPGVAGALWVVFGCKGDDDDERKRRLMGRIAARFADRIVLTTDNPFREEPGRIVDIIAQGVRSSGFPPNHCHIILDRREAIRTALKAAAPGDVVFIAGRGHEQEQHLGDTAAPLDDAQFVSHILSETYGQQ